MIFPGMPEFPYGAYHGSELPFLLRYGDVGLDQKQQVLSGETVEAWTRFAKTGRPGWERQDVRIFTTQKAEPVNHRCDLWSS